MTNTDRSSGSIFTAFSDNPAAAATALVLGGLVGVAIALLLIRAAGDEAPIRVKNGGSVELHLLAASAEWVEDGNRKKWKLKGSPSRNSDNYEVVVAPTNSASCTNGMSAVGNPVTFTNDDNSTIEIRSNGRKSTITTRAANGGDGPDLTKKAKQLVAYDVAARFIREIKVTTANGDRVLCTFGAKDNGLLVILVDQ